MRHLVVGLLIACCAIVAFAAKAEDVASDDSMLNVWVVAHSHDDTGWLLTVDDYYTNGVQYVYDTVVKELVNNPSRKFIFVEVAYFQRWWQDQTPETQQVFKELVEKKQIEFILGGWCMNDEAVSHYNADIDQMTVGHEFLLNTLGVVPRIAWHIDPFGSSSVTPELWAMAGFDAFIINRIDYRLKDAMKKTQELEFIWQSNGGRGVPSQMFTHVLDSHYCTPDGFNWEHDQNDFVDAAPDTPSVTLLSPSPITAANIKERADLLVNVSLTRAAWFRSNNVLIPFGCDFQFQNAWMMYKNMDRLMAFINANSAVYGVRIQYSTLSDYVDAARAAYTNWPVRQYDFLPYADDDSSYWTGYFSSRPTQKALTRIADATSRTAEMYNVAARLIAAPSYDGDAAMDKLTIMRHATAVAQHHDGITGTERQHVADDYIARLTLGTTVCDEVSAAAAGAWMNAHKAALPNLSTDDSNFGAMLMSNQPVAVVASNSLGRARTAMLRLPCPAPHVRVVDSAGHDLPHQVNGIPYKGMNGTLYIRVSVPAMGYTTVFVSLASADDEVAASRYVPLVPVNGATNITNEFISLAFDSTGVLESHTDLSTGVTTRLQHEYFAYNPAVNDQPSGAYIFRPNLTLPLYHVAAPQLSAAVGDLVQETLQTYPWSSIVQHTRLYRGMDELTGRAVDTQHIIGPVDYSDGGKEVMSRWQSDISSGTMFFTDNNGLDVLARNRNLAGRPGDKDSGVALAGNFYPVVSRAFVTDNKRQFTVLSPSTHAGTSAQDGELELMLHRRLLVDDGRGVGEPLNDTSIVDIPVWFMVSDLPTSAAMHRILAHDQAYPVTTMFGSAPNATLWASTYQTSSSLLSVDAPENVHIVSLKWRDATNNDIVVRLLQPFAEFEHPVWSQPAVVDLAKLFGGFTVQSVEERTLTLNRPVAEPHVVGRGHSAHGVHVAELNTVVQLAPLALRTFVIHLK